MDDLYNAIINGNRDELDRILMEEPSLIDNKLESGVPIALYAAQTGHYNIVKYIVEYSRASLNLVDDEYRNMLHYGTMSGNIDIVKYLVEKVGLDPAKGDYNLITPYDIAYQKGFQNIYNYYKEYLGADITDMYRNPIRTGMFPDPSVVRVGDDYYMVNSSFIYFPCIPVSHSKDLVHWRIIGYAITNPEWAELDELSGGRGYWAPDISYYEGKFYIAATYRYNDDGNVYRKQIVVSSDRAEGPYSRPVIINEDGIDPSIFNDDDGRRYMLLNRGARIFELNKDGSQENPQAELLYYGDYKRAPEGPHLLKKDGYYYLFEAEGGTGIGHRITVSRSRTLRGNYEPCPYNPIMRQDDPLAPIQRCGHGKPVQTVDGRWYMVYLCGRMIADGRSILGRETCLDEITWTMDGWPIVNKLQGPGTLKKKPINSIDKDSISNNTSDNLNYIDDFDGDMLGMDWITPRPPMKDGFYIRNGCLCIQGSLYELDSVNARNIFLRRQTSFEFRAELSMRIPKLQDGQNAGLTCYYDENTFIKFGVFKDKKGMYICVMEHIGEVNRYSPKKYIDKSADSIIFIVDTSYLTRCFSYILNDNKEEMFYNIDKVDYLCDEGYHKGKRFTGAMSGLYAYAGEEKLEVAYMSYKYTTKGLVNYAN